MKIQEFLLHHGIGRDPFAEEDADSDRVFKQYCLKDTHHPAWGKIFGSPEEPSTSVVFGEKGSGKSALRLQIVEGLLRYSSEHPDRRMLVIRYNDFNPYLDRLAERSGSWRRDSDQVPQWRLWDHMDAILSLGVTQLGDYVLRARRKDPAADEATRVEIKKLSSLTRVERRDLLLLAAFYDQSTTLSPKARWHRLKRKLRFECWPAQWDVGAAMLITIASLAGCVYWMGARELLTPWPWACAVAGWLAPIWRWLQCSRLAWQVQREIRVVNHQIAALRHILLKLGKSNLQNQPIPRRNQSVDRYDLLEKFQGILRKLGFTGITVLVDQVDEPHRLGGSPDKMRTVVWPLLDNKFLTHRGLGVKLLLPMELADFLTREDREFLEKSRLDKHNLIRALEWSGESLYDVASDRLSGCRMEGSGEDPIALRDFFEPELSQRDLISSLGQLRVPRHLFKFLHRLMVEHCTRFTDDDPRWKIGSETFHTCHALYLQELNAFDRGLATV